jgi:hypothetical protein
MTKITLKMVLILGVLAVLIVSVAGCTSSTNSSQTPSATPSTATHDAFLDKFLGAFKTRSEADKNFSTKAWEVTWSSSTSARLEWTVETTSSTNHTANTVMQVTKFSTSQDATNYLNAMNKTDYSLASNICSGGSSGGAYQDVTGHAPQICKDYKRSEGDPNSFTEYREYHIFQLDNLILGATLKILD